MATCLLSCYGLFVRIHSYFTSLGMLMVYNYSNTCLYAMWSTLIFISCIASRSSLGLSLMNSLPKGESMGTKLVELFANRVAGRRNMIISIYRGELTLRVLGGVRFRWSFWVFWAFCAFELFLALLCHFGFVCHFLCLLLVLRLFPLLDDLLELFVGFWFSSCASWGLRFEI
jgi:hypothetical protein